MFIRVHKTRRRSRPGRPWVLRWKPAGALVGRQMQVGSMSERAAECYRQAWQMKLNGIADESAGPTWEAFVGEYLTAKADLRPSSLSEMRRILADFEKVAENTLGRKPSLGDLSRAVVENYKADCMGRLSRESVRKHLRTLHAAFAWAVSVKYLAENPAAGIRLARQEIEVACLSWEQTQRLLEQAEKQTPWIEAAIRLAVRWGLRIGELAALERRDVDFRERLIHIRPEVAKARKARFVPLDERTAGLLQELSHRDEPLLWGPPSEPFTSAWTFKTALRKTVCILYEKLHWPKPEKAVHILRATAYTNMRRRGTPQHVIERIIGHSGPTVGDRHYDGRADVEVARDAVSWLDGTRTTGAIL